LRGYCTRTRLIYRFRRLRHDGEQGGGLLSRLQSMGRSRLLGNEEGTDYYAFVVDAKDAFAG
jgi:hypothetical protein